MSMTGTDLRKLLAEAGWSQRRLARELGVSPVTVWRWASGRRPITRAMAIAILYLLADDSASDRDRQDRSTERR